MAAGRSTFGTFLMIILGIFGVLLVLRLVGGLFNRSAGRVTRAGGMGMPGPGMGGGPGYVTAVAATAARRRVLSERARRARRSIGRQLALRSIHRRPARSSTARPTPATRSDSTGGADQGGDAIIGADDDPGGGTSWDDGGGGEWWREAVVTGAVAVATGAEAAVTGAGGGRWWSATGNTWIDSSSPRKLRSG